MEFIWRVAVSVFVDELVSVGTDYKANLRRSFVNWEGITDGIQDENI